MRSLVTRLTVLEQLTILVAVIVFSLTALLITARALRNERRAFVTSSAVRLAAGLDDEFKEERDTLAAARAVIEDGVAAGLHVELRDPVRGVLASSRPPLRTASRPGREPAVSRSDEVFVATATSHLGLQVTVLAPDVPRRKTLAALAGSLLLASIPILVLSLLFGRSIVGIAVRPLSTMAGRAASLSVERKPHSLGSRSGLEELDRLADSFDRVLERLGDALSAERRLTADASHELRTPLTVLGGELDMLLEKAAPGSPAAAGLRRAADQVRAMGELVEAILLLHRSGEAVQANDHSAEILNLCDIAREVLAETLLRYPGRAADVELHAPDEILVAGRGTLLAGALRNLVDNALKFTRAGDRVEARVAEVAGDAVFTVDDQGPGVRDDERERIFTPFFRGAEAGAGVTGFGLGLPILRRVARAHGGEAEVLRSPLGGACFVVRLPRLDPNRRT
jgi:signal transduction histidine kinase